MKIIAHRGLWKKKSEQNTIKSINEALNNDYGIETDIRDYRKKIVVSHDMPSNKILYLEKVFQLYKKNNCKNIIALNIKADGLQLELNKLIRKYNIRNYFIFDMSIPESIKYLSTNLRVYMRLSEYEKNYQKLSFNGLWIDQFKGEWIKPNEIENLLRKKIDICLVSSELHQRSKEKLWKSLRNNNRYKFSNFSLCTDYPDEARKFFNV